MDLTFVHKMSDRELLTRVQELARHERHATAALVAHLSEMERRQLYLEQGCRSLFTYCTQVLHLSEHAAYNRIEVARIALRFPAVLTHLAAGDLHLTAIRLLAPCLTSENQHGLLTAAKHKSKREVEEMVAQLRPRPDAAASVRKLPGSAVPHGTGNPAVKPDAPDRSLFEQPQPEPASAGDTNGGAPQNPEPSTPVAGNLQCAANPSDAGGLGNDVQAGGQANDGQAGRQADAGHDAHAAAPAAKAATIVPLAPERYRVQFTANAATCAKLRRAQELLRHRIPAGDVAAVIDEALDLLVRDLEKKKFAAAAQPRRSGSKAAAEPQRNNSNSAAQPQPSVSKESESRHIPAAVKRAVWQRDGGRCAFVGGNGLRCTERGQLEFDHIQPYADGGAPTAANVRLLCRQHNQHEARSLFGTWQSDTDYSFQNESSNELSPQVRTG